MGHKTVAYFGHLLLLESEIHSYKTSRLRRRFYRSGKPAVVGISNTIVNQSFI